jgi:hypothetical protein
VFIGFVYARAESFSSTVRADTYRNIARAGLAPFTLAMICGWLSLSGMSGDQASYDLAVLAFRATLVVLSWYAFVVVFMYL